MKEFELMKKTLYPNKLKSILFLILTLVFVIIGIYMLTDGEKMGWLVTVFFGLGMIVFIVNLFPQASYLKLDKEGFETCSLFKKHRYSWSEIGHFGVGKISNNKMVMFNFSKEYQRARKIRKVSSIISGAEGALHDNFGLKAEELAELMNAYKIGSDKLKK